MALADLRGACHHCGGGPAHSYYLGRGARLLCDDCAVEAGFDLPARHKWSGPHPAERANGIMHSYFECDLCGQCWSDPANAHPVCPA